MKILFNEFIMSVFAILFIVQHKTSKATHFIVFGCTSLQNVNTMRVEDLKFFC